MANFTVRWKTKINKMILHKSFKTKNKAEKFLDKLEVDPSVMATYPLWDETPEREHSVNFVVHKTGSVSMDHIRWGASTIVAKALREIARSQDIDNGVWEKQKTT